MRYTLLNQKNLIKNINRKYKKSKLITKEKFLINGKRKFGKFVNKYIQPFG